MTTRIIRNFTDVDALANLLRARKLPVTVSITAGESRSSEQNRLAWKWYGEVAAQLEDRTIEEVRGDAKLRFGVPILRADNGTYAETYDRLIRPRSYEDKLALMMAPHDMAVTRLMTTRQLTRYLDAFAAFYAAQGVALTIPEAA